MQWAAFLTFTVTACYTPGPNIIFATNTARLFGFRRAVPLMYGMTAGLLVIMSLNALANMTVADLAPRLLPWLRLVGAAYLFWLSYKLAFPRKAKNGTETTKKVPNFTDGFALQFMNPKVILFGFTAMSTFIAPWTHSRCAFFACGLFLTLNCAVAFSFWAAFGDFSGRRLNRCGRAIDLLMGLLLAWCAWSVSGLQELI
jgi:cysteine/O-acetylserine efflux protein